MVCGFLGTLISLERAVALAHPLALVVPLSSALGVVALMTGAGPQALGPALWTAASAGLAVLSLLVYGRRPSMAAATVALGAFAWMGGNALWLSGWPLYLVVPWWEAFLVATIAGERLELSAILGAAAIKEATFAAALGLFLAGVLFTVLSFAGGMRIAGAGLVGLSLWAFRYDLASRTLRQPGLPRFMAASLLCGYAWLAAAGVLRLWTDGAAAGPYRDAVVHALFLGFVFAMIFAHGPVILPSLMGLSASFGNGLYLPLALLELSLILRVAGALGLSFPAQRWGGLLGVLAIVGFIGTVAGSVARATVRRRA
jgi:hypothetical protein